ncbi:glycosyltransferase family 2 protein [Yoonia sediminilitoris]|uniref:Glycosyl transferase family 2 n=1 Tax=Yoonia sediminilitoris TaxID=1286148 RepID=A0A2T6KCZ4_9RHOB|nr:glycosyltransferase family 2 protein [Yoonia sediminilitoris]PUB12832.1 glycosyl transferase family 2 [Yoonia sediminilitoris]RCW94311.1 glycosyl transferase family 2 [Yoonia sediminilitoris]
MRVLAVTTMRNEAPFVLEWIAYHQHIGVTDFLIYSNDCDDGTDALLDRLTALGVVQHERNHSGGNKTVQWRALGKARRHPLTKKADWIYVTDVDEFLCIHEGAGRIADLLAARPDADGFAIPWRMFGNAGVQTFEDTPVLTQFTQAAPDALLWPWRAVQFKSLFRNAPRYHRLGVHRPKLKEGAKYGQWVDGNGNALPPTPGTLLPTLAPRYDLAQINHYALGAVESFLVKVARGKPNHTSDPIDLAYWSDRNLNAVTDERILRHQTAVTERVQALRQDAEIDRLHKAGVAWRKARIEALKLESDSFYMMARLLQMPATTILPAQMQKALFQGLLRMRREQGTRKTAD